jgi:hypothetical protein
MLNLRTLPILVFLALVSPATLAQDTGKTDPLFDDHSVIVLTITAPMPSLLKQRPNEEYLPGRIEYTEADGSMVTIDTGVRTRGNYHPEPPDRYQLPGSTGTHYLRRQRRQAR